MSRWPLEILTTFVTTLRADLLAVVGMGALVVAVVEAWRAIAPLAPRSTSRAVRVCAVMLLVSLGVYFAAREASLLDDAFISFRYADNFANGEGLVFNPGERVEGYTNFLWTVAIGVFIWLGFDGMLVGFFLALLCFTLNLVVIDRLARAVLDRRLQGAPPLALALVVGQYAFTSYGTTGLETACASLLVNIGALYLVKLERPRHAALAGLFLILATLTRPDQALFYGAGAIALVVTRARPLLGEVRAGPLFRSTTLRAWLAYAAPFTLYVVYLAWKLAYYGDTLPNTYYAKSADLAYWPMGGIYALTFYLSSHFWVPALLGLLWAVFSAPRHSGQRRFKVFGVIAVVAFNVYVAKVGGDFMYGRFYVSTIPLVAVGAATLVLQKLDDVPVLLATPRFRWVAALFLLGATTWNLDLIQRRVPAWYQADEVKVYRLTSLDPPTVAHPSFRVGLEMRRLGEAGVRPLLATTGPGMVGYLSGLPIVDQFGLVDRYVARLPLKNRSRPGHEKHAPVEYLRERGVHIVRRSIDPRYDGITALKLGRSGNTWYLLRYDPAMMKRIRAAVPDWSFVDFEAYLDKYVRTLHKKSPADVAADLAFFRTYYFDTVRDPARLHPIEARARQGAAPAPPSPSTSPPEPVTP